MSIKFPFGLTSFCLNNVISQFDMTAVLSTSEQINFENTCMLKIFCTVWLQGASLNLSHNDSFDLKS